MKLKSKRFMMCESMQCYRKTLWFESHYIDSYHASHNVWGTYAAVKTV
jgi:hypothetical protein